MAPWSASARILLLLVIPSSLHQLPAVGAACRAVTELNYDCLKDKIIVESSCNFVMSIYEDCPEGVPLFTVGGDDLTLGSTTDFRLVEGNKLSLSKAVDAETAATITSIELFQATEQYDASTVLTSIVNVNEFPPIIMSGTSQSMEQDENTPAGTVGEEIVVQDQDAGETENMVAVLETEGTPFDVQRTNGTDVQCTYQLYAKEPLDYETRSFYNLVIKFTTEDIRGNSSSTTLTVMFFVRDLADSPPFWIQLKPTVDDFEETDATGVVVYQVVALDRDVNINNPIKYSITAGNEEGLFTIDASTGVVATAAPIDREAIAATFYSVTVMAVEQVGGVDAAPPNNVTQVTNIQIKDVNDNCPTFLLGEVVLEMDELTSGGSESSVIVVVTDMDELNAGSYTLSSTNENHLSISPPKGSGNTTFKLTPLYVENDNIFDYEGVTDGNYEIVITVTATEVQNTTHTGVATLTIKIKDVNDNSPKFDSPGYNVTVKENTSPGSPVTVVSATDKDVSDEFGNSSIRYTLKECSDLAIDDATGEVTVSASSSLDYEVDPVVTCTVEARDNGGGSSNYDEAIILISLTDENDTPPSITVDSRAEVFENASRGDLVLTVYAEDKDSDASVTFTLEYDDGTDDVLTEWFTVVQVDCDGGSGFCGKLLVTGELDYEYVQQVVLRVVATDVNTISNKPGDTATVTVSLLDVNDESPTLCTPCGEGLTLRENSVAGTEVARFTATDPDTEDQGTLLFSCSDNDMLTMDEKYGNLSVKTNATVDREEEALINITVTVTDKEGHTATSEVSITVVDVNDNAPVLDKTVCSVVYRVSEDAATGHSITVITATDEDQGIYGTLIYDLNNLKLTTGKNPKTPFAIDPDTGNITVFTDETAERVLDREDEASWLLNLRVYDQCGNADPYCTVHMDECYMTVVVEDVNDEAPALLLERTIQAREDFLKGYAVENSIITAVDADKPDTEYSEIHYKVIGFENSDGVALTEVPFEAVDSDPVIGQSGYTEWSCTLKTTMDLTHMVGTYQLIILATDGPKDGQGLAKSSNLTVTINIQDSNDYPPKIVMKGCLAENKQNISIHENIYEANARIPCVDNGEFAELMYTDSDTAEENIETTIAIDYANSTAYPYSEGFTGQLNSFELQKVDSTSYGLYVKDNSLVISHEAGIGYNLSVRATNKAVPRHSSTSWIFLNILWMNLNKPVFCEHLVECVDTAFITENVFEDATFRNATDMDNKWGVYDEVRYYIIGGDTDIFIIPNNMEPVLRPTVLLDRESKDTYTVVVQAINNGTELGEGNTPTSTDMMLITVEVLDQNDEPPIFDLPVQFGSVVATGSPGQVALVLQADDRDLIKTLSYKFTSAFEWEPNLQYSPTVFTIDELTGTVTLGADPQTLQGYCLVNVTVTDELPTAHFDNAVVQIFVVTSSEQVPFYFRNDMATLQLAQQNITEILTETFDCIATVDSITSTSGTDKSTQDSILWVHFVNTSRNLFPSTKAVAANAPGNIVAKSTITSAASSGVLSSNLQNELLELGLSLYRIGELKVDSSTDWQKKLLVYQIVLAVVVVLLGSMLFLLMAAYVVRTTSLERRVKVLTTNTFGSKASELNRAGVDAVPNSNLFRGEGANPVWNTFGGDLQRQNSGSISSGDSVLVGVEDNPEFRDYKGTGGAAGGGKGHGKGAFVTSINPLFAGLDDETGEDAPKKQRRTSYTESQNSGDLGVPNFSFL